MDIKDAAKDILLNKDYKTIIGNFVSLSGLTAASYILPLITFPYLTRVLGPEKFGLIAFATAFITYFVFLTDYGFYFSATKEVSIHQKNREKISEIFTSVMITKGLLFILSLALFTAIILSFSQFRDEWLIYYLTFGTVIGNVLFPIWFFQGMEKMKYITMLFLVSKIIFTVAIFTFIRNPSDYIYVPLINSMGIIIAGGIGFFIAVHHFNLEIRRPPLKNVKYQIYEGWHVFISTMSLGLYRSTNTFILGLFTNNVIVGYYAVAEQIIIAAAGLLYPISQSIYPYISRTIDKSKKEGIKFIKKMTIIMGGFSGIISILIFILAGFIINLLAGPQYEESIIVLRILAFLPLLIALSTVFGVQTMLTLNYKKAYSNILLFAGILNIILAFLLTPLFQHIGASAALLITEIFVTLNTFLFLQKKGIKLLDYKTKFSGVFNLKNSGK